MLKADVMVIGGGAAGVAAAIASARTGADTLLIEPNGYLGGTITHSSLPAFCPFTDGLKPVIRGIGLELMEALRSASNPVYPFRPTEVSVYNWFPIDTETFKIILDEKVIESGCRLLLHTQLTDCRAEDGRIKSVTLFTPAGPVEAEAKIYVDCSGDGYLSARAGCEIEMGDTNGDVQSGTLCFKLANFDTQRYMEYARSVGEGGNMYNACNRAIADGKFLPDETKVSGISFPAPGVAALNFGHVYHIDPLDPASMTRAEMEGRKLLSDMLRFFRTYVPGAEEAVIVSSGPAFGVRESRRVMGRYVLTEKDYYARADFDDAIAYYCYPIDIHGSSPDAEEAKKLIELYKEKRYKPGEVYGVPYRCLTPKGMHNLLTAGRIISSDRSMQASLRVVPCCFATGQAAGTAAATASAQVIDTDRVNTDKLREKLKADGVWLKN